MNSQDLGLYLVITMLAMAISMVIIPQFIRWAPKLGMLDQPDPRKVHSVPIPRVGGVGIVVGALVPMAIWLPFSADVVSVFIGALILLVFGTWDDVKELGHYVKFLGQFSAAIIVVYYGDIYVTHFPFMGLDLLPEAIGRPFTVIAIVGVINALNHSDGLDGLAGGESLLSLGAIVYLAYIFDGLQVMLITAAVAGGIFGFLRFNSHPARVFMGDGGSQFIGFILAVLVVLLTQQVNPVFSPALPALLLGLPVLDILAVFFLRAKHKMNLFKATSNHVHHRLLQLGFYHYQSVIIIYSIQTLFVVCAVLLPYEGDGVIISIYLGVCFLLFFSLTIAERRELKVNNKAGNKSTIFYSFVDQYEKIMYLPYRFLKAGLSFFFIAAAIMATNIPVDFGVSAVALLILLIISVVVKSLNVYFYRLVMFVTIAFSVFLLSTYPPAWLLDEMFILYSYFVLMSCLVFICVRLMAAEEFHMSPLDYLMILMALISALLPETDVGASSLIWMVIQIIILFYACEMIVQKMKSPFNRFTGATALALGLIAIRGLI